MCLFYSSSQCLEYFVMFFESSSFRRNGIAVIKPVTFHYINRTSIVVFKLVHHIAVVGMFVVTTGGHVAGFSISSVWSSLTTICVE